MTLFDQVQAYVVSGGFVMPVLLAAGLLLWTLLGLRIQLLRRGFSGNLNQQLQQYSHKPPRVKKYQRNNK